MNTEESIEFLEEIKKRYHSYHISTPILNRKGAIRHTSLHFGLDIIIDLLRQGEEYKRILEHIGVISNNEQVNKIIRDTLLGG